MADLYSSSTTFDDSNKSKGTNKELEEFLAIEKEKAQFNSQMLEFSEICWDKCVDKPGSKLDGKTETCLHNCVDRFIDVSLFIASRYAQMLQKAAGAM